ncbi:hypothetical protein DPMN_130354 [Dreissena polymorpha]|uniref:Uncharacterized protein n=1 Tax=Dreissena polymorpha TaxID=45954 RepID=A0A9D4JYC3_DREPO|nr:hypothetical protein DPMN_130354 [Dreissena polymorpha]
MFIIAHASRPRCDFVFAREPGGRPTLPPIGKMSYARGGLFPSTVSRAQLYVRLVVARLQLKDHTEMAVNVKNLDIEDTETVSDLASRDRVVSDPFAPPRPCLWFLSTGRVCMRPAGNTASRFSGRGSCLCKVVPSTGRIRWEDPSLAPSVQAPDVNDL